MNDIDKIIYLQSLEKGENDQLRFLKEVMLCLDFDCREGKTKDFLGVMIFSGNE